MTIALVDTSVLTNILDVPGRNQQRDEVIQLLEQYNEDRVQLLLPFVAVLETGRHISQLANGRQRRRYANGLVDCVRQSLNGEAPWSPIAFPKREDLELWIDGFPGSAMNEVSLADHGIIAEYTAVCERHRGHRVFIWSYDGHMAGHDREPEL